MTLGFFMLFARQAELLFDVTTKKFLVKKDIHKQRYPASLTKQMTLYLLFKALKEKKVSMETKFKVSKYASAQIPLKMYFKPGEKIKVKDLIHSIILRSANDAAVCVAENLTDGDMKKFIKMMNKTAKKIGMKKTRFTNPSGLPDKAQVTTAYDLLKLSYALYRDYPKYFHHFKKTHFYYNGRIYHTTNHLLHTPGIYGMKTGFTCMSRYNIATTAVRLDNKNRPHFLIAVVMGQNSKRERDAKVLNMINRFYKV